MKHDSLASPQGPGASLLLRYIQPAPGIGFGIFRTNRLPRFDEDIESLIFVPQLMVGVKF